LSIDGLADDLAALLDTLGIESARVTGHSLGTLVTAVHLPSNRLSAEVKSLDDEHWDSSEVVPLWNTGDGSTTWSSPKGLLLAPSPGYRKAR
jgi:hypothetical protein